MAAYMGHVLSTVGPKIFLNSAKTLTIIPCRNGSYNKNVKRNKRKYVQNLFFQSKVESIQSKGFLRNLPSFSPPEGITDTLRELFEEETGTADLTYKLDSEKKHQLLTRLSNMLSHSVPNSLLHKMQTLGDIFEFYHTPNSDVTPFDRYKEMELPPNLHIVFDYQRFHPDTDTMFNGVTAFPKSSTFVTGLRYKKKYKGHTQEPPWSDI